MLFLGRVTSTQNARIEFPTVGVPYVRRGGYDVTRPDVPVMLSVFFVGRRWSWTPAWEW